MLVKDSRSKKILDKVFDYLESIDVTKLTMDELKDFLEVVQKGQFLETTMDSEELIPSVVLQTRSYQPPLQQKITDLTWSEVYFVLLIIMLSGFSRFDASRKEHPKLTEAKRLLYERT